jgi:large subunit ribosomal protein L1
MIIGKDKIEDALLQAIENSTIKSKDEKKPDRSRKFDETIDLIINLRDVDIKTPANRIDIEHLLPHPIKGNNSKDTIAFIAKGDMELELKELGYNVITVDALDTLQKKSNKEKKLVAKKYKYFIASADLMKNVAKVLARFLGQQGKMPKPQPKGFGIIRPNEDMKEYLPKLGRIVKLIMKKILVIQTKVGKKNRKVKKNCLPTLNQ